MSHLENEDKQAVTENPGVIRDNVPITPEETKLGNGPFRLRYRLATGRKTSNGKPNAPYDGSQSTTLDKGKIEKES